MEGYKAQSLYLNKMWLLEMQKQLAFPAQLPLRAMRKQFSPCFAVLRPAVLKEMYRKLTSKDLSRVLF